MTEHDLCRGMPDVELPAATDQRSRCSPRPLSMAFAAPASLGDRRQERVI